MAQLTAPTSSTVQVQKNGKEVQSVRARAQIVRDVETLVDYALLCNCLLYTSPSPRDVEESRMPSSA